MNKMRLTPKSYFWLVFILLLAACSPSATASVTPIPATPAPATPTHITPTLVTLAPATRTKIVDLNVFLTQVWMTVVVEVAQTRAARPTVTITRTPMPPSATYTPGPSLTPRATPTPLKPYTLNGLRAAYILDGNLYLQDSGAAPVQLSESGTDSLPQFSDDGQRLMVFRESDVFVIHLNDSEEGKKIVLGKLLAPLKLGYDKSTWYDTFGAPIFVPHTHQLLFQTAGNSDLVLLDVDSRKVSQLLPIGAQARYFKPSPDGKLAWVWVKDHIDVVNLRSKSRQRVADYIPFVPGSSVPSIYWTNDSKRLNIILPIFRGTPETNEPLPQAIWQVALDGSSPIETRFDPPVKLAGDTFSISPDGNWIVYNYCNYQLEATDNLQPDGTYLGNLQTGEAQFIDIKDDTNGCLASNYHWASDSIHFIFEPFLHRNFYLGNIHKELIELNQEGVFLSWLDDTRYLNGSIDANHTDSSITMGYVTENDPVRVLDLPLALRYKRPDNFAYIFLNP